MDKLKQMLTANKPKQKVINHREQLAQQKQEYFSKEKERKKQAEQQQKQRVRQLEEFYDQRERRKQRKKSQEEEIPFSIDEVKTKLRELEQPVTLFGQTEQQRYKRYQKVKKFYDDHPGQDMKLYDQEFHRKVKENQQFEELDAKFRNRLIQPKLLDDPAFRSKKFSQVNGQKDRDFTDICDQLYLWIKKVLKDWSETVQLNHPTHSTPEDQAPSLSNNSGSSIHPSILVFNESSQDLQGLLQVLKKRSGDKQMITSIYHIMNCCLVRQYIEANDKYIDLSIGNAPWPMGVAMLGITVKRNRERLSHVLNNQVTRRWIQCLKRLISVSQELYPNEDQMKMAGFTVKTLL